MLHHHGDTPNPFLATKAPATRMCRRSSWTLLRSESPIRDKNGVPHMHRSDSSASFFLARLKAAAAVAPDRAHSFDCVRTTATAATIAPGSWRDCNTPPHTTTTATTRRPPHLVSSDSRGQFARSRAPRDFAVASRDPNRWSASIIFFGIAS
ncbi:hypothetical protein BC828DRAFT_214591 [Blastocladiella britannica]|nr:hypothetical protein BC828DRAFT_214591 [Blastocladiella britannica]